MSNSAQFSLAVHAMLVLAYFQDRRITSQMIAERVHCHPVVIRNCFAKLSAAGLLVTRPGKGKNELSRPAGEITLWDIFAAVEGEQTHTLFKPYPLSREECAPAHDAQQLLMQHCQDAITAMREALSAVSIQDMIDEMKDRYPEGLPGEMRQRDADGNAP